MTRWRVPVGPGIQDALDARYRIRLRSWDRLYNRDPGSYFDEHARDLWKERWRRGPAPPGPIESRHNVLLATAGDYDDGLYQRLRGSGPMCLAPALAPPGQAGQTDPALRTLEWMLLAGTPIVVWPGVVPAGRPTPERTRRALRALVEKQAPDDVPPRIHRRRRKAGRPREAGNPLPTRHLCLLWDDPDRLPPAAGESLDDHGYAP